MKKFLKFFLILFLLNSSKNYLQAMEQDLTFIETNGKTTSTQTIDEIEELTRNVENISLEETSYDSDSENEEGYQYNGYESLEIGQNEGPNSIICYRGIHFDKTKITKNQRSQMRRQTLPGQPIYSSAVYDLSDTNPMDQQANHQILSEIGNYVKKQITNLEKARHPFQQKYTNNYDGFHKSLNEKKEIFGNFKSSKNPQVSSSESFRHAGKYAFGLKFLGMAAEKLDPEYNSNGKPKHPYLGKIYIILVDTSEVQDLDPYFVVHGHANNFIKISTHFSNDILSEREVSFPGFIPGKYVVFQTAVRVPSFLGEYKQYYLEKYGISERSFKVRKGKIKKGEKTLKTTVKDLIEKIIQYTSQKLEKHVKKQCLIKNINIVYKDLDNGFSETLPDISTAR